MNKITLLIIKNYVLLILAFVALIMDIVYNVSHEWLIISILLLIWLEISLMQVRRQP